MTPNNSDYLNAINAVKNPGNASAIPTGYTLLYSSTSQDSYASNGLNGAAYLNPTTGQIIIAYFGQNTVDVLLGQSGSVSEIAGAAVDQRIGNNDPTVAGELAVQTTSFTAAVKDAAETAGYSFTNSNVFVTGFSEGGLLAQCLNRDVQPSDLIGDGKSDHGNDRVPAFDCDAVGRKREGRDEESASSLAFTRGGRRMTQDRFRLPLWREIA
jgi:hypothetical protein